MKRMPYITPDAKRTLLTTAEYPDNSAWGTIVSTDAEENNPSKWIYRGMKNPGSIWYWVNENNCDKRYVKG